MFITYILLVVLKLWREGVEDLRFKNKPKFSYILENPFSSYTDKYQKNKNLGVWESKFIETNGRKLWAL